MFASTKANGYVKTDSYSSDAEKGKSFHVFSAGQLAELVSKVKCGDQTSIEDLYRLLSKGIRWQLVRRIGITDAEDKLQDVFLSVVQGIQSGSLRAPECLPGYTNTIVKRSIAATINERVRNRQCHDDNDVSAEMIDYGDSPEKQLIDRHKVEMMKRVLQEMPARDREILTRFYLHEETPQEICRAMELNETQFRLLKYRAKVRFGELGCKKQATAEMTALARRSRAQSPWHAYAASAAGG